MTKTYQWYYDGSLIGGATSKTHTLTSGQTDSNLIECRVTADYGTDSVGALAEYASSGVTGEFVGTAGPAFSANNKTFDLTGIAEGDLLYFVSLKFRGTTGNILGNLSLEGSACTAVVTLGAGTSRTQAVVQKINCPAAAANNAAAVFSSSDTGGSWYSLCYKINGTPTNEITGGSASTSTPSTELVGDLNTGPNGFAFGAAFFADQVVSPVGPFATFTGLTERFDQVVTSSSDDVLFAAGDTATSSLETPRTVRISNDQSLTSGHSVIVTVALW